jgi:2-amino-4-hydroxy-6-hydroxymethyldihydropteridine diphosphokinase
MGTLAHLGLGSNVGDRKANLGFAIASLADTREISLRAVSGYRETPPVGGPAGQGAFLNAAAAVETTLSPERLLDRLQAIENATGRIRGVRWGSRSLDLDLLLFGDTVIATPRLQVPHPRMKLRRFVLAPLAEIASAVAIPNTPGRVSDFLANLDRRPSYVAISIGTKSRAREALFASVVESLGAAVVSPDACVGSSSSGPEGPSGESSDKTLERRARVISQGQIESLGERWLVSSFDLADSVMIAWERWKASDAPRYEAQGRQWLSLRTQGLRPTFVVRFEGPGVRAPRSYGCTDLSPVLYVDEGNPDAAVSEILATCAATRAG